MFVYKDLLIGTTDEAVISQYEGLEEGGVPEPFIDSALVAENEEQARSLAIGFMGGQTGRQGYANTSQLPTADEMASAGIETLTRSDATLNCDDGELNPIVHTRSLSNHQTYLQMVP